jgi:sn-glycerol 3-phosphate transport system permease protein
MERRVVFEGKLLPYLLVAPQLAITLVFFFWPAAEAVYFSTQQQDAFGLSTLFVGFENFTNLFGDPDYLHAFQVTAIFSVAVTALAMLPALLLAVMADRVVRFAAVYKTALMLPYAVAPAIAGVLWLFLFAPGIGIVANALKWLGVDWNYLLNGNQALLLVIIAAAWKQLSYNFLFFLAGLQAIPKSLLDAASIDGAGGFHRFRTIVLPLLSPTTFFLFVVDVVYAFFETFGVIHAVTGGGPSKATEILIYKVYYDGVVGLDLGGSSAQSVVLMIIVIALTAVQFRYVERRVHY